MLEEFSGDFRIMRVVFASNDPIETLHNIKFKYSYRTFIDMYEMLEAKETLEEDERRKLSQKYNNTQTR